MSLPTREEIIERIGAKIGDGEIYDSGVNITSRVLDELSVEDHLILLEQMLAKARVPGDHHLAAAHRFVSAALDQIELHILEVVI